MQTIGPQLYWRQWPGPGKSERPPVEGSRCRQKAVAGQGLSHSQGRRLPRAIGRHAMQSILDETQDVELLLATALTAAGYVIGAAVFLAALV